MASEEEKGAYRTGKKVKNWDKYNPHGYRITPFIEEQKCPLCESKADVLFPITINVCPSCWAKIKEHKDVYSRAEKHIDFSGHFCDWCGKGSIVYYTVNTRVCNKCTVKLGEMQYKIKEWAKLARKIA